ncbi:hypothetical protein AWJ14_10690 [Hoeflea olei]|uniref:Peptidoglycan binding-like domain-containing protein n=2 Tax=Hoeflea olei TaxID=1480615 RepID=A0A1C1Z181_9HYPH|nr:hypothetical protein AWJ14_10690 [Hoeflea olei]
MDKAGTCYATSFDRQNGPIREITARFTRYQESGSEQGEQALVKLEITEWDVPNQTFGITGTCSFTDKSIRCGIDCDGGHAILSVSETGELYFHSDTVRYDSLRGDASLLTLNEADGYVMDGLFVLKQRPGDSQCRAAGDELFVAMQAGDISNRVTDIETKLRRLGQFLENPDTVFDEATRAAVSGFQRQYGLPDTGVVDQDTAALLANLMQSGAGGC